MQTLFDLAVGFGAEIVGECMEAEAESQALRYRGVRFMQGYHFGAPTLERPWNAPSLRMVPTA